MKKAIIKALSVMLVVVITLTSAPLSGLVGLELPEWLDFSTMAKAFDEWGGDFDDGWGGDLDDDLGVPDFDDDLVGDEWFFENFCFVGDNICQMRVEGSKVAVLYGSGEMYDYFGISSTINKVIIDSRISYIGENTFSNCNRLTDIYYTGTEEQWNQIVIGDNNEYLYNANIHYDSEMPAGQFDSGAFWFFDETKCTLALRGEGGTDNYDRFGSRPWDEYRSDILYIDAGFHIPGYIGDYTFCNLYYLEEVRYTEYILSYGKGAFLNCYNLKSIDINEYVYEIGDEAFKNCTNLSCVTINCYDEYSMLTIGDSAFAYCDNLTNVTIGNGVTTIGDSAFRNCYSLTSITIPDSVTTIGDSAFGYCYSLTSITIPDNVTSIGDYAFDGCESLADVTIGNGVTTIGDSAFGHCYSLTSITIPDSVTTIGDYAFAFCNSLTDASIGNRVTTIGDSAFGYCYSLTSITIPDSVISIGDYAFDGCECLADATIGNGVTTIGDDAFSHCSSLTSITIPDSVTTIGDSVFYNCESLTDVKIGDGVTIIGDWSFYSCDSLTNVTIGNGVTTIGDQAFAYCTGLANTTIPDSVTTIGEFAFYKCTSLTSVTIPDSVTKTGDSAFDYCESLTDVYYLGAEDDWNNIPISICNEPLLAATLHITGTGEHTHSYTAIVTSPTCTKSGYTTYTCECGETYMKDIPTTSHTYEGVTTDATASQPGFTSYICSACNYESLVLIDSLNYVEGLTYKANTVKDVLLVLNEEDSAYKIFDADGTELSENDLVGTGAKVYIYDANTDELLNAYTVVLYGDVNGDGLINEADQEIITSVATCKSTIDNQWFIMAADTNHDGAVDGFDVIETELQTLDMHNIEQKNNNAYLPKDEEDESKPEINEEDPDGDGWWG